MIEVDVSFPLAFLAGLVSFLSPCVLPVVPSSLAFITGATLEELRGGTSRRARSASLIHTLAFVAGFGAVFMTLGFAATSFGRTISAALPWLNRLGGGFLVIFGLVLLGVVRIPALAREWRAQPGRRPAGPLGSFVVGLAFGAGWTPCIGPVLGSILLYASLASTRAEGTLLLGTYALGLGFPFVLASVSLNVFLARTASAGRWLGAIERVAGAFLVVLGVLMLTGGFATLSAHLAGLGQWINLETR